MSPKSDPRTAERAARALTHHAGPFRVGLGRAQRLAVLRHVQDVGVQFGRHGDGEGPMPGGVEEGLTPASWIPAQVWKRWRSLLLIGLKYTIITRPPHHHFL